MPKPKEFIGLSDWVLNGLCDCVLSHWFSMEESSHTCGGRRTKQ